MEAEARITVADDEPNRDELMSEIRGRLEHTLRDVPAAENARVKGGSDGASQFGGEAFLLIFGGGTAVAAAYAIVQEFRGRGVKVAIERRSGD